MTQLAAKDVRVARVIDAKAAGQSVGDHVVLHPDTPEITHSERADIPLILGIFNCFVDISALRTRLAGWGWTRIIDYTEIHAVWPDELGNHFWLTNRKVCQENEAEITKVSSLWADETSRELYQEILRFRVTGCQQGLQPTGTGNQYFPADVPPWKTPLRLIDCGGFDGDTLRQIHLRRHRLQLEAVATFEPDLANFARLAETLRMVATTAESGNEHLSPRECIAFPCGVWERTVQLRFNSGKGGGSDISQSGETLVQCVSIDDALPGFRPTLIKMDIEGAEVAALHGARSTISCHRPGLAICVYHKPDDLWCIPLLLDSWQVGYRFYLRLHRYSGFDLVLYALPELA